MDELSLQVSILIDFFTGEVGGSGQTNLRGVLHAANDENWHCVEPTKNLIDLDVVFLALGAS